MVHLVGEAVWCLDDGQTSGSLSKVPDRGGEAKRLLQQSKKMN
jgi:hypothetical protein